MGDNNKQEAADLAAMNNGDDDDDNLFEVRYLGGRLDNDYDDDDENPRPLGLPDYNIPADVNIRLTIDQFITKIDNDACFGCTTLTEVVFHNNVTEIGRRAFSRCSNLQSVELPAGLLRIEYWAFDSCTSLRGEILFPASIQYIGNHVFCGCTSLENVVFAPRTTIVELGAGIFSNCSNLRFVKLPHNVRSIPRWCFMDCTSLTNIRIPVSVEVIEECAFVGSGIQSIVMLENVHQIDRAAFQKCAFLEKVTFHSTHLNFTNNIFVNCPSLTVIMIAPWLWPKLFVSMNGHPEFIFKFFREYQTQIFDFQIVNPDVEVEGEGTLQNNIEDNNE